MRWLRREGRDQGGRKHGLGDREKPAQERDGSEPVDVRARALKYVLLRYQRGFGVQLVRLVKRRVTRSVGDAARAVAE